MLPSLLILIAAPPALDAPVAFGEVVVRARRGPRPPPLDAIGVYRRYCFDAMRIDGRPSLPEAGLAWGELDAPLRRQFGLPTDGDPAYGRTAASGQTLLIKIERRPQPGGLVEWRCTLVVVGGTDQPRFERGLNTVFAGPGTERHVEGPAGEARLPGWTQRVWTGNPARTSRDWRVINAGDRRRGPPSYVYVTDRARFFAEHRFILGDLKQRIGATPPVSVLTFAMTERAVTPPRTPGRR